MSDDPSLADRIRAVAADVRRYVGADEADRDTPAAGPDGDDEPVAPLERTLVEKQDEKMNEVADDLSEE